MDETLRYMPEQPPQVPLLEPPKWWHRISVKKIAFAAGLIPALMIFSLYFSFVSAPEDFQPDQVYTIHNGDTLTEISSHLKSEEVIRSDFVFKVFVRIFAPRSGALAGDYEFDEPQNAVVVAWRVANGLFNLKLEKITVPEGLNVSEISNLFVRHSRFTAFDEVEFKKLTKNLEGKLFPDTYLFLPNATAAQVVAAMTKNYERKIKTLLPEIEAFKRPIEDVIKMASILEEEGRTEVTRETIAGILWKRLDQGMPLQVDASIVYLTAKKSGNFLSSEDFKVDSPYNTYQHKGLPPTPISNPGIDAIKAAIHPISSKYYYYLTDPKGGFYPAATYEEHLMNKAKYLK